MISASNVAVVVFMVGWHYERKKRLTAWVGLDLFPQCLEIITQSDEVSLIMSDLLEPGDESWRGGVDLREVVKVLYGHLRADSHPVHLIMEPVQ